MNHIQWIKYTLLSLTTIALSACAAAPQSGPQPSPSATTSPNPVATPSTSPSQPVTAPRQIAYGKSFGFCVGYCDHQLTITAERMRLVHTSPRDPQAYPEQVIEKPTPAETWQKLNRFARFETLQGLPDRIGCPDCADGGAEWIELQQNDVSKRVTFEPQAGLPQQAELLAELRKLYEELDPQE